jgi:hypothetical protein
MSVYALTPLVKSDIFLSYIAEDNVDVADRVSKRSSTPVSSLPNLL